MKRTVDDSTVMSVHASIKYKKSVWGVIKGFIEKNTWLGLEDFYEALSKALMVEYCLPPAKAKSRRKGKNSSVPLQMASSSQPALPADHNEMDHGVMPTPVTTNKHGSKQTMKNIEADDITRNSKQERMSWIVIILLAALIAFNVILYVKLWKIDGNHEDDSLYSKLEFLR